jgi:hypothetical protein
MISKRVPDKYETKTYLDPPRLVTVWHEGALGHYPTPERVGGFPTPEMTCCGQRM